MTTVCIIEGLQILEKYHKKPNGYNCGAEHDVLYGYPTDDRLSEVDLFRMVELGWTQPDVARKEPGGDFRIGDYDPNEGWAANV